MRLIVSSETFEQLFDPAKRPAELERARQDTLRRGQQLRQRRLERQQQVEQQQFAKTPSQD